MMTRRDAMFVTAGAAVVVSSGVLAQPKDAKGAAKDAKAPDASPVEAAINQALIDAARGCMAAGTACLNHCIKLLATGDKSMVECTGTVRQMLPLCTAIAELAQQNAPRLKELAAVCAKACRDCEAACKKHANHHAECKACMESCQKCAAECEKAAA